MVPKQSSWNQKAYTRVNTFIWIFPFISSVLIPWMWMLDLLFLPKDMEQVSRNTFTENLIIQDFFFPDDTTINDVIEVISPGKLNYRDNGPFPGGMPSRQRGSYDNWTEVQHPGYYYDKQNLKEAGGMLQRKTVAAFKVFTTHLEL